MPNDKTALTPQAMDSTSTLKLCCDIWQQLASSRFFKSCKMQGGASLHGWICLSSTSPKCLNGLRYGEFGGQVNASSHSRTIFALCNSTLSC